MYDQAFESFQGSLAPRCNSGVVQMGYNSHNGFVSQVLATAASSKANQTALQQPAQPSSAPAPTGAVRLLSPGELKTEPVGVTRGVLADFTQEAGREPVFAAGILGADNDE